jgi:GNAT superfamily N-acetyltransferase
MTFQIRSVRPEDHDQWSTLWNAYLVFYEAELPAEVTEATWQRINTDDGGILCLVAEDESGKLLGMTQFLFHLTSWSTKPRCYLHDLFTVPESRGQGVAKALIKAVEAAAAKEGACEVYWMTQEFNDTARKLYDKVATKSPFIEYVI